MGCRGAESPGWFDISQKNCEWDPMHEQVHCCDESANHRLPIVTTFWIIQIVSKKECCLWGGGKLSLMQNLKQIHCSSHSVVLNAMAIEYICLLKGIYFPYWLVQWSHHCSCICIPIHSPWLPSYISAAQIILDILTMVGLWPDRHPIKPLSDIWFVNIFCHSIGWLFIFLILCVCVV